MRWVIWQLLIIFPNLAKLIEILPAFHYTINVGTCYICYIPYCIYFVLHLSHHIQSAMYIACWIPILPALVSWSRCGNTNFCRQEFIVNAWGVCIKHDSIFVFIFQMSIIGHFSTSWSLILRIISLVQCKTWLLGWFHKVMCWLMTFTRNYWSLVDDPVPYMRSFVCANLVRL